MSESLCSASFIHKSQRLLVEVELLTPMFSISNQVPSIAPLYERFSDVLDVIDDLDNFISAACRVVLTVPKLVPIQQNFGLNVLIV